MARPRTLSPKMYWHVRSKQWVVKILSVAHYLGKDEAEAERRRCLLVAAHLAGQPAPTFGPAAPTLTVVPSGPLVAEVLALYERHARERYGGGDLVRYLGRVLAALDAVREVCGPLSAQEFTAKRLKEVRGRLLERPSRRGKLPPEKRPRLSRSYVNSLIGCIQTAWEWLASEDVVPADRAVALRTVASLRAGEAGREMPQIVAVPEWVVEATLPYCSNTIRAMVRTQQYTGCRPTEVCTMRPRDLARTANDRIEVPGTRPPMVVSALDVDGVPVWVYVPESHKTLAKGKRRLVPLGPRAQQVLAPLLEGRSPDAYLFSPAEASDAARAAKGRRKRYGRGRQPGARYSHGSFRNAVQRAVEAANRARRMEADGGPFVGVPMWAPGQLRKLAASLSDEHADRDTTASLLGHSSPQMSAVYADQALGRAAKFVVMFG